MTNSNLNKVPVVTISQVLCFALFAIFSARAVAQTTCPSGTTCYQVPKFNAGSPSSSSVQIDLFGQCAYVNNERTDYDILVPTNTSTEWTTFVTAVNAGNVPNVSVSCCGTAVNYTSTTTYTPNFLCPTAIVEAWGAGGGGGTKTSGTSRPGGSGGYAKHIVTGLSSSSAYNVTIAGGGACNRTAGTGDYTGGTGGSANACSVGLAGGGTGTGGNIGTKVNNGCNGGLGKWGGGGGGGGASAGLVGSGGGGATTFSNPGKTVYYVVAGGGGGAGAGDQGAGGTGGAACGAGATGKGGNGGAGGDPGGGGGGGACGCWNGSTLALANCTTTANGTGATAPTPNPGAGYVTGGTAATGAAGSCVAANNGSPGYMTITPDSKTATWKQKADSSVTSGASVTTASFTSVTAGSLIVCGIGQDSARSVTSLSGGGNTFIKAVGPTVAPGSISGYAAEIWYAYNVAAGTYAITTNFDGATTYAIVSCHEYSGIVSSSNPLNGTATASRTSTTTHTVSITPTTAHVMRFHYSFLSGTFSGTTSTQRSNLDGDFFGEAISHTFGTYSSSMTTSGSVDSVNFLVTFKIQ